MTRYGAYSHYFVFLLTHPPRGDAIGERTDAGGWVKF